MLTPDLGSTVAVIWSALPDLKPSERLVAERIVADPDVIPEMSASDLGARCGTSAATVVRACQAMGFKGFQHVRTLLIRDAGAAAVAESGGVEAPGLSGQVSRQLLDGARQLELASNGLDEHVLEQAVELLTNARRIVIVGSGSSSATIQALALRFTFSGIAVETPGDSVVQALACRLLGAEDVCVAISDSGMSQSTLAAAEAARKAGAAVIAVTGYARSRLAELGTVTLAIGVAGASWQQSVLSSNLVQMVVLNALQVEVARRRSVLERSTALASEEVFESVIPEQPAEGDTTY